MKPLGMDRSEPRAGRIMALATRVVGALLVALFATAALYVTFVEDPLGGEPHALVPIEQAASEAAVKPADGKAVAVNRPDTPAAPPGERASAAEVEAASGVSVVRPDGGAAPTSIVIRVPDAFDGTLASAPDQRLVERTRHGLLPRTGPDGARSAEVYARPVPPPAAGGATPGARLAIVVGGLGIGQAATADAIAKLPAPVSLAFAPYGNDLETHVTRARQDGHEVLLQAPMEPFDYPDNDPGPHTLTVRAKGAENLGRLHWAMARFSGYVGIINFMGGKLTADEATLAPILRELGGRGLVFVDDGSSSRSLAEKVGAAVQTPVARADLVLDGVPRADAVDRQLERLEQLARQRGFAIASASALPVTVDRIAAWARSLESRGVSLVPVTNAFAQERRR
jgi:polysaccharide deacetylase 2 family uncharacterized protein YibQ